MESNGPYNSSAYIVGTPEHLAELFPNYKSTDVRTLPNGKAIYEISQLVAATLKDDTAIEIFTHEEVITQIDKIIADTTPAAAPEAEESAQG